MVGIGDQWIEFELRDKLRARCECQAFQRAYPRWVARPSHLELVALYCCLLAVVGVQGYFVNA